MRLLRAAAVVWVLTAALVGCSNSTTNRAHTIQTDNAFTEFPASYFGYFPRVLRVHPGDSLTFKQAWTGEPHTVTFGTAFRPLADAVGELVKGSGRLGPTDQQALSAATSSVPSIFDASHRINQTLATSCYVSSGSLPASGAVCPHRKQPEFTGRESIYNSGFIPYQGTSGNSFGMKLADSIKPGDYFFYCALHGPTMGGFVRVVDRKQPVDSASVVARRARSEAAAATARLRLTHTDMRAEAGDAADIIGGGFSAHAANGLVLPFVTANDFEPHTLQAKVGQAVTWFIPRGPGHTISFDAPRDLPSVRIDPGGYQLNPKAFEPQGGPGYPQGHNLTTTASVDAGNYDGSFFLSSGFPYGPMRYTVTFTKAGTYRYVCLLHPKMDGAVVVT